MIRHTCSLSAEKLRDSSGSLRPKHRRSVEDLSKARLPTDRRVFSLRFFQINVLNAVEIFTWEITVGIYIAHNLWKLIVRSPLFRIPRIACSLDKYTRLLYNNNFNRSSNIGIFCSGRMLTYSHDAICCSLNCTYLQRLTISSENLLRPGERA